MTVVEARDRVGGRTEGLVRRIEHAACDERVIARDGTEYRGDAAVVTPPPTLAGRLEHDPPLPSGRDQLTQRMPGGSVIKAYAIYPALRAGSLDILR